MIARARSWSPTEEWPMPDAEVGGGHRHDNSLAEVVLIDELSALIGRHRNHPGDGGRGRRDVARALPHSRQFAELIRIGDDQEVPGLAVRRRRRSPTGLGTVRCDCASLAGGLTPCLRLCGAGRGHSPVAVRPFRACFSLRELHAAAKPQFAPRQLRCGYGCTGPDDHSAQPAWHRGVARRTSGRLGGCACALTGPWVGCDDA